jgi:predicted nucleic acid-binding protein
MILVDSSVLIAFFNNADIWQVQKLDNLLGNEPVIIGDLILTEVLQGFGTDNDFKKAKEALLVFPTYEMVNQKFAIKSAENYRMLRKNGITLRKTIDMLIGTFCIENEFILLHDDKDFEPMVKYLNLKVINEL